MWTVILTVILNFSHGSKRPKNYRNSWGGKLLLVPSTLPVLTLEGLFFGVPFDFGGSSCVTRRKAS